MGDCTPFLHHRVFLLFWLLDKGHHHARGGLGDHQWARSTTTDLLHWEHHPLAIPITAEHEAWICTGAVFHHGGVYRAYYATRYPDGSEHLSLATSMDSIHFETTEPNPFASPAPEFTRSFRDPHVFRNEETGLFYLLPGYPGDGDDRRRYDDRRRGDAGGAEFLRGSNGERRPAKRLDADARRAGAPRVPLWGMRGSGSYGQGYEIRCSPDEGRVEIRNARTGDIPENAKRAILGVKGLDRPFGLHVLLKDDIIDACVDGRRTLVARCPEQRGDRLFLLAHCTCVAFRDVSVRPLA